MTVSNSRMDDQVTQAGFPARLSGTGRFRRTHEVAEVHSPHSHVIHARSMGVRRGPATAHNDVGR